MTGGASPRRRGDYFERQTVADMEAHGWLVVRFPGSGSGHSMASDAHADILAVRRGARPALVSCKISGRIPPSERAAMIAAAVRYGCVPLVAVRRARGVIGYRIVDGGEWSHDATAAQ